MKGYGFHKLKCMKKYGDLSLRSVKKKQYEH